MTDVLEEMRAQVRKGKDPKVSKKIWVAPEVEDFAQGWVLAFDQTLTKTGWVVLTNNAPESPKTRARWAKPGLWISHGGVIKPPPFDDLVSFEQTLAKAEAMAAEMEEIIVRYRWVNAIVHEMPSVHGHRIESSLMAVREIRRINAGWRPVFVINRQSAYATLVGDRHAPKRMMKEAVERLIPEDHREVDRWTQDVSDAAGVGLKHLHNEKVNDAYEN